MNGTKKVIRILLVDDYEIFRHGLRAMLESEDDMAVVGECASAEEAFVKMARLHPNIVLMDAQMPGISGIEALCSLRRRDLDYGCAVIIVAESSDHRDEALRAGAAGFLLKEITQQELIWTIRQVYRKVPEILSRDKAVELVVSPSDDKARLLRFVCQLEERLKGTYGAAVVAQTAGSFERGAVITVLVSPDALASLSESVQKMPEVERVEELLGEDAFSSLPKTFRLPLRLSTSLSKRMQVTLTARAV